MGKGSHLGCALKCGTCGEEKGRAWNGRQASALWRTRVQPRLPGAPGTPTRQLGRPLRPLRPLRSRADVLLYQACWGGPHFRTPFPCPAWTHIPPCHPLGTLASWWAWPPASACSPFTLTRAAFTSVEMGSPGSLSRSRRVFIQQKSDPATVPRGPPTRSGFPTALREQAVVANALRFGPPAPHCPDPFPCHTGPRPLHSQAVLSPAIPVTAGPRSAGMRTLGTEAPVQPPHFPGDLPARASAANRSRVHSLL